MPFLLMGLAWQSQGQVAFAGEIKAFKQQDSLHMPPPNEILFVGSSSFRKWTDVQSYFPNTPIINRGFGGSTLPDVIYYANDLIFPYKPKQIVIYCGDNDFASSDTVTAAIVFSRFNKLYYLIRKEMPVVDIVFVSIKPSPSRRKFMKEEVVANKLISDFISHQEHAKFVDVYSRMLLPDGDPMPDIFLSDSLHMNAKGYAIWKKEIGPVLMR